MSEKRYDNAIQLELDVRRAYGFDSQREAEEVRDRMEIRRNDPRVATIVRGHAGRPGDNRFLLTIGVARRMYYVNLVPKAALPDGELA